MPAKFQRKAFHRARRRSCDGLTCRRTTGEGDLARNGVRHQRLSQSAAKAGDHVEDASRQTCFIKQFGQKQGRQWGIFAWLGDDRTPRRKRSAQLYGQQHNREVERGDCHDHTHRFLCDNGHFPRPLCQGAFGAQSQRLFSVDVQQIGGAHDLVHAFRQRAPQFGVQGCTDLVSTVAHRLGTGMDQPNAFGHWRGFPDLEPFGGRGNRDVSIHRIAVGNGIHQRTITGVQNVDRPPRLRSGPSAINEHLHRRDP